MNIYGILYYRGTITAVIYIYIYTVLGRLLWKSNRLQITSYLKCNKYYNYFNY